MQGRRDRRRLDAGELRRDRADPAVHQGARTEERDAVNDAYVETIDILPTIFDVLNLEPAVKMDGHSAFSAEVQNRRALRILQRNTFEIAALPGGAVRGARSARVRERNHRLFGTGADGPRPHLPDRPAPGAARPARAGGRRARTRWRSRRPSRLRERGPALRLPAHAPGRPDEGGGPTRPRDIAVAVNGRSPQWATPSGSGRGQGVVLGDDPGVAAAGDATAWTCRGPGQRIAPRARLGGLAGEVEVPSDSPIGCTLASVCSGAP